MTIAILVLRPNSFARFGIGDPDLESLGSGSFGLQRRFPAIRTAASVGGGYLSPRCARKDEVRKEVWKAMDREGVSRFPGAEGRIPNFAGAKLAAEKLAGAPALEAGAGDQGQPRLAPDPRPPASRWRRARP